MGLGGQGAPLVAVGRGDVIVGRGDVIIVGRGDVIAALGQGVDHQAEPLPEARQPVCGGGERGVTQGAPPHRAPPYSAPPLQTAPK